MTQAPKSVWRSRAMIIGIALISAGPLALAWYYARHPELIEQRSNYGHLFQPPAALDLGQPGVRALVRPDAWPEVRGRWVLLQLGANPCDAACAEVLHKSHQARLMLSKEIARVRRVLVVPEGAAAESFGGLLERDEDVLVATVPPGALRELAAAMHQAPEANTVILMDPLGNLALWYEPGFDPYKLVKDLRHLLRASQIG